METVGDFLAYIQEQHIDVASAAVAKA
jgi:hypothetical protein